MVIIVIVSNLAVHQQYLAIHHVSTPLPMITCHQTATILRPP
jgi:hypothetical protein